MGLELGDLIKEVREASANISERDTANGQRIAAVEKSVNELLLRANRPRSSGDVNDNAEQFERKDAVAYCRVKHAIAVPKDDGSSSYIPSSAEIDDAMSATTAMHSLFRHGNIDRLPALERKSLTSFSFGSNQFVLPPQMSDRVLSCLTDPTDVAGLVGQASTSGGSLKFMIDNSRMLDAAWACEASCFANNPQPDLQEGLGELEIKAETIRYVVCVGSDLLQDAAFNIEMWILRKAAQGFRNTINAAIVIGDGLGKPLGILNPQSGVPICETSNATPAGQYSWQDLVALKMELPIQWHAGASFWMNQRTFGLLMTMSDANSRPLWGQLPGGQPGFMFAGSPIVIVSWMPDVAPGSIPVGFGNWAEAYTVVTRSGMTMRPDLFSSGFCTLFRFEQRVGGSTTCPKAVRLLRIR